MVLGTIMKWNKFEKDTFSSSSGWMTRAGASIGNKSKMLERKKSKSFRTFKSVKRKKVKKSE